MDEAEVEANGQTNLAVYARLWICTAFEASEEDENPDHRQLNQVPEQHARTLQAVRITLGC